MGSILSKKSKSGSARFFCLGDNHPKSHTELATTRCQRAPFDSIGHELPFPVARNQVCNAAMNRHSALSVGNVAVCVPSNGPG
jgi:hypothetical protein